MKGHNFGLCKKCGEGHIHPRGMLNKQQSDYQKQVVSLVLTNKSFTKEHLANMRGHNYDSKPCRKSGCKKTHKDRTGTNNSSNKPGVGDKISKKLMNRKITWNDKISETVTKLHKKGHYKSIKGSNNPMFGKKGKLNPFHKSNLTEEQIVHHREINKGSKNPMWNNGSSFEPYGLEFNKELRLAVRIRDMFKCKLCGKKDKTRRLCIHHIDYNKKNNKLENLVSLCNKCHGKTNTKRRQWVEYFSREFNVKKQYFSWEDIYEDCLKIAQFLSNKNITAIVPIIRGGIVPAIIISNILNKPIKNKVGDKKDVIIDEIIDFGVTFKSYKKKYPKNIFVCLHVNTKNFKLKQKPDYYVRKVKNFIVYPWENKNSTARNYGDENSNY